MRRTFVSTFVEDKTDVGLSHTIVSASPFEERAPASLRQAAARRIVLGMLQETCGFVTTHDVLGESEEHLDALEHYMISRLEDTICLLRIRRADSARSGA